MNDKIYVFLLDAQCFQWSSCSECSMLIGLETWLSEHAQWARSVGSAALCGTAASIFSHFHQNCSLESLQLRVTKIPTGLENGPKARRGWRASGVAHFTPPLRDSAHRRGQGSLERTKRHHHHHWDGAGLNKAWAHAEVKWANWAQVCLELRQEFPLK